MAGSASSQAGGRSGLTPLAAPVVAALEATLARRLEATLALAASLDPDAAPTLLATLMLLDAQVTGLLALLERFVLPVGVAQVV
jgi:hypothetical protein